MQDQVCLLSGPQVQPFVQTCASLSLPAGLVGGAAAVGVALPVLLHAVVSVVAAVAWPSCLVCLSVLVHWRLHRHVPGIHHLHHRVPAVCLACASFFLQVVRAYQLCQAAQQKQVKSPGPQGKNAHACVHRCTPAAWHAGAAAARHATAAAA